MKTLFVLTIVLALAAPVFAREGFKGYRCENECPLAQRANAHRSYGTEAVIASTAIRADVASSVEKNLLKI